MGFERFLDDLFESGRIEVPTITAQSGEELAAAEQQLKRYESIYRRQLPLSPPPFAAQPALWSATLFYRACQLLVHREYGEAEIDEAFAAPCPEPSEAATHYSVDLTMRLLPDLVRLARAGSPQDPLAIRLTQLAADWPLSSVGISEIETLDVRPIIGDRSLRLLYIDRIIARRDLPRLADQHVRAAVSEALGLFPDVASEIAAALDPSRVQETTS